MCSSDLIAGNRSLVLGAGRTPARPGHAADGAVAGLGDVLRVTERVAIRQFSEVRLICGLSLFGPDRPDARIAATVIGPAAPGRCVLNPRALALREFSGIRRGVGGGEGLVVPQRLGIHRRAER